MADIRNAKLIIIDNGFLAFHWEKFLHWGYPPPKFFYITLQSGNTILEVVRDLGNPINSRCGVWVSESWQTNYDSRIYTAVNSASIRTDRVVWRPCR